MKQEKNLNDKKDGLIIGLAFCFVVIAALLGFFIGTTFSDKVEKKSEDKTNKTETKEQEKTINLRDGYKIKEVLFDTTSYGNNSIEKVELTEDGDILLSIIDNDEIIVNRLELFVSVEKSYLVHVGQSDTCEGNARLIFDRGNNLYTYLNIDDFVCSHKVTTGNIMGLENVQDIEEKVEKFEGEPDIYKVYAVDKQENKSEISDKLLNN